MAHRPLRPRPGWPFLLIAVFLAVGACGPRPSETVGIRTASSVGAAPTDTTSFAGHLAAFTAADAAVREEARRRVVADRAAWREFEDIAATRRDRLERPFYHEGLPFDRRKLGYGLVAAQAHLQNIVAADPTDAEAWAALALYSVDYGDLAGARVRLERARAAAEARSALGEPVPADILRTIRRERAWVLRDLGLWDAGLAAADEGLAADPGDLDLQLARGLLLAGAGRFAEAIDAAARLPALEVRVKRGPQAKDLKPVLSDYGSQWIRAQAYAAQGDLELAFHALGQNPDDTGRATYIEGGTQDRKLGTETTMPRQARFWNDTGLIAELLGLDAAVDYYTRAWVGRDYANYHPTAPSANEALVLGVPDPQIPYFTSFFGRHYMAGSRFAFVAGQLNRMSLATSEVARREAAAAAALNLDVLARHGARPDVCHALRGRLHYRLEQWTEARHHLAQARGAFTTTGVVDPRTSLLLGMIDLREQRFASAAALFEEALGADPELALGWRMLGVSYANLERMSDAVAAMDRAVALEPASLAGRYNRGLLMLQLQRCEEAVADLSLALRLDPEHEDLPRLLQLAATCGRDGESGGTVVRSGGAGGVRFEADLDRLVEQLGGELARFFTPPDTLRPALEERLTLLQQSADAADGTILRGARAVLLSDLGRHEEAQALLADAWQEELRPPEDLILLHADWELGEDARLAEVVTDALAGRLQSSNPYLWALALMEVRRAPERWGADAEAQLIARWFDRSDSISGTSIRYWTEVLDREMAMARGR